MFSAKYHAIIFYVGFTDRHGAGLTPFQLGIKPKGGVKAMPNLLLAISGICIVAFVLRETLEDLQKKKEEHDHHHVSSDKQG